MGFTARRGALRSPSSQRLEEKCVVSCDSTVASDGPSQVVPPPTPSSPSQKLLSGHGLFMVGRG